jgi:hypothetical protein
MGKKHMKIRTNKHRVLSRLAHNNKSNWFIAPLMLRAEKHMKFNAYLRKMMDAAFPEQRGL